MRERTQDGTGGRGRACADVEAAIVRYEAPLLRYAAHLVGDAEAARDVVQDVFLDLCRDAPPLTVDELRPWLFTVCRHRAIDLCRKERRMMPLASEDAAEAVAIGPPTLLTLEREDVHQRVLTILRTLPPNQEEVVRLRFLGELSYREIGEVTGLSESNVGYLIHTAIRSLRSRLQADAATV